MKKTRVLAVLVFALSFSLLQAQTNQGNFMIGAESDLLGLNFSTLKFKSDRSGFEEADADKVMSFNLSPKIGYFVVDNIAVGLDFTLATSRLTEGTSDDETTQSLLAVGPFVRYYVPASTVLPFVEVGATVGRDKTKFEGGVFEGEYKSNILTFGGGVGVAAPLGDKVMLDIMAGYNSVITKDAEDNDDNDRMLTGNIGVNLGFTVFIGNN